MRVTRDDQTGIMSGRCNELGINIFSSKKNSSVAQFTAVGFTTGYSGPGEKGNPPSTEVR